jgi:hypothetical protein
MAVISPAAEDALTYFQSITPVIKSGATEAYRGRDDLAYAISQVPCRTPRAIKIICVGAGFSGLSIAKAVSTGKIPNATLTVYEKNASVGGTWYENRYPGYVRVIFCKFTSMSAFDLNIMLTTLLTQLCVSCLPKLNNVES